MGAAAAAHYGPLAAEAGRAAAAALAAGRFPAPAITVSVQGRGSGSGSGSSEPESALAFPPPFGPFWGLLEPLSEETDEEQVGARRPP